MGAVLKPDSAVTNRHSLVVPLDGWWERKDRSILASAFAGLLGVGVLYFNLQAILLYIMIGIAHLVNAATGTEQNHDMFSILKSILIPVRVSIVVAQFAFILAPTVWIVRRWHSSGVRSYLRLRPAGILEIILPIVATLAMIPLNLYVINLFMDLLGLPEMFRGLNDMLIASSSLPEFLFMVFVIGVTPAICEEVFFRGLVQRTFERLIGWKSVLLTGLLFGLYHMQPLGLFTLSLMGVVLGFYFYSSRSLLPGMVAHFTNNAVIVYLSYAKPVIGGVSLGTTSGIPTGWMPASIVLASASLLLFYVHTRSKRTEEMLERRAETESLPDNGTADMPAQDQDPISDANMDSDVGE